MNIISELEKRGFERGLYWTHCHGEFSITVANASDYPPPLVYVIVDRNGESVRVGRSLTQTVRKREGSTAKGLNGQSTEGQNNKSVILGLRREIRAQCPLTSYVKCCATEEEAIEAEKQLFDAFRGRLDKKRG
jgi:hypothetical protein